MQVTGPSPSLGSGNITARLREALAAAGIPVRAGEPATVADRLLIVHPAAWYAEADAPPPDDLLRVAVGYSVAPYGSVALQDDAEVGRRLTAIAHPDARCTEHLRRVGCRVVHVPLGCRPVPTSSHDADRPVHVASHGEPTERRLRVLAGGARDLDDVPCAHLFPDPSTTRVFGQAPLRAARVLVDVAPDDDAAPDLTVLLAAAEAGAAVVSERLGSWPTAAIANAVTSAPPATLFRRARELAADPAAAAARADELHAACLAHATLQDTARGLATLLALAPPPPRVSPRAAALSPHAAPPEPPPPIAEVIRRESSADDAAIRAAVQQALSGLRTVRRRLDSMAAAPGSADVEQLLGPARVQPVEVSVVVPAYSADRTITATLESVREAASEDDAPTLEVIVVDDASPGDDAAIAVDWACAHPEVPVTVLQHGTNRGLSAARNTAVACAVGAMVLALDADDLLRPRGLRRLVDALDRDAKAVFAYGIVERFDLNESLGMVGLYPWAPERLRYGNYIPAQSLLRRDALLALGGYVDMEWGFEDWELWCRVAQSGGHGVWVPEVVIRYRQRTDSMSAGLQLSRIGPLTDMLERHPELLR
ncbi:MAG: glycosyl transferase family 2 [Solirubrobacterales bacterium]|nr:glycosyl transferase family 2 [Solirubrobacterales bacterium]